MAYREFKVSPDGKVRTVIALPEAGFRKLEAEAKEMGITVTHLCRMKLLGFEPRRAA